MQNTTTEEIKAAWEAQFVGPDHGKLIVAEPGCRLEPIGGFTPRPPRDHRTTGIGGFIVSVTILFALLGLLAVRGVGRLLRPTTRTKLDAWADRATDELVSSGNLSC